MIILSVVCAIILSVLASALKEPQDVAKELDRSSQMLIAAKIFDPNGYFLIKTDKGELVPAKYLKDGILVPGTVNDFATRDDILSVYRRRIDPFLVDDKGNEKSFKDAGISEPEYTVKNRKNGYANLPLKLVYRILPNPIEGQDNSQINPEGYVFPVSGFGLWDAIYGYIAIRPDGDTVIGISWYDHKETPGLGANITEASWQIQFPGKKIFQSDPAGNTDFKYGPIGVNVVRGKVVEVIGTGPKASSAVDGMPGATLTGNGVTKAYKDTLTPYRAFLVKLHEQNPS